MADYGACLECGRVAEPEGRTFALNGVGTRGQDIVVWFQRWHCVIGHHYQLEVLEEDADVAGGDA